MAKALKCEYEIDIPEFSKVSSEARDLVQSLLLAAPDERLTADQCLSHPWLSGLTFLLFAVTVKQLTRQLTDYSLGKDFRWDTSTQDYIKMV